MMQAALGGDGEELGPAFLGLVIGVVTAFRTQAQALGLELDDAETRELHDAYRQFLALLARTGDELWLRRARAFAMHALAQAQRFREAYGRGRYTLWTGDAGLAVYLWHCLDGRADLPALDTLQ